MKNDRTHRNIRRTGISLFAVFCTFFSLGLTKGSLPLDLKHVEASELLWPEKTPVKPVKHHSFGWRFRPGTFIVYSDTDKALTTFCAKDTTIKRVMIFGDSQVECLHNVVYNFCAVNNYQLVASVCWYGSTTQDWGGCDTLQYYIKKYKPDFVICALGLNEILIPNVEPRRKCVRNIESALESNKLPYYWIGPAAWKKDQGIVNLLQEELDTLFFPSDRLVLDRASDKRHPSKEASKTWFDSVTVAMNIHTPVRFLNKVGEYRKEENSPMITLANVRIK